MRLRWMTFALAASAAAAFLAAPHRARAQTGLSGDLGETGGNVRGDISRDPADMDTVTVTLMSGQTVDLRWAASFAAAVQFTDPDGTAVAFSLASLHMGRIDDYAVTASGTYTFSISSQDGTQGAWTLRVRPHWAKTVEFQGTGQGSFDVAMPSGSALRGVVRALGGGQPSIVSLTSPDASELLAEPIVGKAALARLPATTIQETGVYRISVEAVGGTTGFQATLHRRPPAVSRTNVDLRNGIDAISFSGDGIEMYFNQRCASCHDWARSYVGVRAFSRDSLSRMKSGSMPRGGPRTDGAFLNTFAQWISSGYGK